MTTNNAFGGLSTDGIEESQDRLGGFRVLESGPYTGKIKAAYAGSAASGARSVTIIHDSAEGGEYRETFWLTNKKGENFYTKDGKKQALPGFTIVNDICLVTCNKPLSQMATEDKVMNVYAPEAKKEMPKSVPMIVELLGKEVTLGILKQLKNKQKKNSTTGDYEDTDETREENVTDKIFHVPSNLTVVEATKGIQTPTFYGAWVERNKGQTQDRRSNKDGTAGGVKNGRPNGPPKSGDNAPKTASLFG